MSPNLKSLTLFMGAAAVMLASSARADFVDFELFTRSEGTQLSSACNSRACNSCACKLDSSNSDFGNDNVEELLAGDLATFDVSGLASSTEPSWLTETAELLGIVEKAEVRPDSRSILDLTYFHESGADVSGAAQTAVPFVTAADEPEPATFGLLALGFVVLSAIRARPKSRRELRRRLIR